MQLPATRYDLQVLARLRSELGRDQFTTHAAPVLDSDSIQQLHDMLDAHPTDK